MKYSLVITSLVLSSFSLSDAYAKGGGHSSSAPDGLSVGGSIDFQASYHDQDLESGGLTRNKHFRNDTEVHVGFRQTSDNGLKYGAVIELEADISAADNHEGLNADKTYIFLQGNPGRLELGGNSDAGHVLGVDASTNAVAAGGIYGDYYQYIYFPDDGSGHHVDAIYTPTLPLAHKHGASEDATKLTYYTPTFGGAQFGISLIPDSGDVGTATGFTGDSNSSQYENVVNAALNYKHEFNHDVSVVASAIGEFGEAETAAYEDLAAYALGLNVHYGHFSLGGSYGDWGDSTLSSTSTADDGGFWSLGAAYSAGDAGFSVSYLDSEVHDNDFSALSFGVDYLLAPGLTPYVEVTAFDLDVGDTTIAGNNGVVTLAGVQLNF